MNEIIKKNAITFGIVTGVISVLITSSIYLIDLKLFTAWWIGIASIAIYVGIGIYMLMKTKKELGGIFSFKDAFTTYFLSAVIGIVISVLFNILLFNFIDTEAKDTVQEHLIEFQVNMLKKFNTPTATIKEAVEKMEEQNQFDIVPQIKGSAFSIIFSALFGLILAAIFKSKPKEQF
ncbi:hypothetical protein SY27_05440 [Flavobacterium sp. 316]|uniref:DUF4199 domain-containing protein n=1 Tax=Flavobacterium sp. 316 TaxID=1603293 RepID=UPI0005DD981F|nr:DUF4199 domain-containing protein [Flavobacterium sp. 316]KIX22108.1 hypothetical protein SY27_05440 [Flavobacterium sp. 316]